MTPQKTPKKWPQGEKLKLAEIQRAHREAEWLVGQESTGEGSSVSYLCSVLLGLLSCDVMPTVAIFVLQLNLIQRRLDIFYAHATMEASSCSTRSV